MKRFVTLLLILSLIPGLFACSAKQTPADSIGSPEAQETGSTAATDSPTDAPTAVPTDDPNKAEALRLGTLHGLGEDDLRGEYALFIRFSETIEANSGLGDFKGIVYKLFPVIADEKDHLDEEYFFEKLGSLTLQVEEMGDTVGGLLSYESNSIWLNSILLTSHKASLAKTLYHELMHFVDYCIEGYHGQVYILDGRHLKENEAEMLPAEDKSRLLLCGEAWIVTEGGAELYTAKYLTGAPSAYLNGVAFLTGIEYIMGEEYLNELFFRWDRDALLEELFYEIGYTHDEYTAALETLTDIVKNQTRPEDKVSIEDILIDLYELKLGGNWKEDKEFLYILKCIGGVAQDSWRNSQHADFLETIDFTTEEKYDAFCHELLDGIAENPEFTSNPPAPFMRGGKLLLGARADAADPETGESFKCVITFDLDFESGSRIGYEIADLDLLNQECFPDLP